MDNKKTKDSGIEWIGEIPEDWEIRRVKNCFFISKQKAKEKNPVILKLARSGVQIRDISTNEGQVAASYEDYNLVQYGDLLLNTMDLYSGANCNMSEVSGVISQAYANLRKLGDNVNSKYYDYYFKSQYWGMTMFAFGKGVSFDNRWTMNTDTLINYIIPYPQIEEQNLIVSKVNEKSNIIDELIANNQSQIDKLKEYKQSVITQAVTKGLDPNVETKDSGIDWIGQIPKNWKVISLKALFNFGKGLPITKADLIPNGVKVISYGQIHAKYNNIVFINDKMIRFVDENYLLSNSNSLVEKNDFIFADTSEDLEGAGDFIFIDKDDTIFAGYHTIVLKHKQNKSNKFLAYLFMSYQWKNQIRSRVTGIKVFSISRGILSKASVILPPEEAQHQIADYLDKKCSQIDSLIELKQQKIEKLQEYKKSLIYEYVTGKKEVG